MYLNIDTRILKKGGKKGITGKMKRKKSNNKRWLCTALTAIIVISIFSVGIVPVSAAPMVERSIDPDTVSPDGAVNVTIEFTADANIFLDLGDVVPPGWDVIGWSAEPATDNMGFNTTTNRVYFTWVLAGAGSYKAEYKLHVPDTADPGEYKLDKGKLSGATLGGGGWTVDIEVDTIEVKPPYGVDLTVDDSTRTTDADVNATYPITVENTGANEDTYDLSVTVPSGADLEVLSEDSVTIPAGESEEVELNVASFLAGDYVTTVEASSVHASDDVTVTTTVRAFYGVDLEVTPEERTVEPDEDAVYTLTVTNSGNADDTIDLSIISNEANFGELSEDTFSLSAGASDTADLTVRDSAVGIYDTTVRATSQNDPTEWVIKTVTTNVTEEEDTTPPAAVTNLAASDPTSSSIKLTWTAPGDDGDTGTATTYDIRYSTSTITEANWATATECTGEPAPQEAGSSETFTVTGLAADTTYYFAIKTADEVPNESPISNSPGGTTLVSEDTTAPAAITDLATSNPTSGTIDLAWTAPGDDGNTGTATTYDIRYLAGTTPITDANWATATQCTGVPAPQVAGSSETFTVTGLSPDTTYYFAIKTADEVPNESPLSNDPSGTTEKGEVIPLPGYVNPPTDPDEDGLYEDLNGNGGLDFDDVVQFFNYLEWIEANEPISCFDFNGNGRIDFDDIVQLFNEV